MQVLPSLFQRLLSSNPLGVIYLVEFEGLTTRYATGTVKAPLAATKVWLGLPTGAGQQITPNLGQSSMSQLTIPILDFGGAITELLFLNQMSNRLVTLKMGFQDLAEESYIEIFKGRVLTWTRDTSATGAGPFWNFSTTDLQRQTKQDIFTARTTLTAPAGSGDVTLNVGNTEDFAAATAGQFYVMIGTEAIAYTGKTSSTLTGCTRGQLGTVAAAHGATLSVENLVVLEGNPLTLALQILTSTGLGTNGTYDVLPASCGLAIPEAQVDVAKFESERDRWITSTTFRFEEKSAVEGKKFLQEQIYAFLPGYPTVTRSGLLSVKVAAPPMPSSLNTGAGLTDDNCIGPPTFTGNMLANYFFNELKLSYDYDFVTQSFGKTSFYEDATSQELFDNVVTQEMQSRGIRTSTMSQTRIDNFGTRFLKRYAIPAPQLSAKAFLATAVIEAGDIVPVTSAFLPNLLTGKIGVNSQLVEVIGVSPNYDQGNVTFTLLNTPYSYGKRYAAISPSAQTPVNFPDYLAATAAQRNYAFISQEVNPTKGIMSNGDDGYYITP